VRRNNKFAFCRFISMQGIVELVNSLKEEEKKETNSIRKAMIIVN